MGGAAYQAPWHSPPGHHTARAGKPAPHCQALLSSGVLHGRRPPGDGGGGPVGGAGPGVDLEESAGDACMPTPVGMVSLVSDSGPGMWRVMTHAFLNRRTKERTHRSKHTDVDGGMQGRRGAMRGGKGDMGRHHQLERPGITTLGQSQGPCLSLGHFVTTSCWCHRTGVASDDAASPALPPRSSPQAPEAPGDRRLLGREGSVSARDRPSAPTGRGPGQAPPPLGTPAW